MNKLPPLVKQSDEAPAGKGSGHCFWCPSKIGTPHAAECPCWTKTVTIKMTIEYSIDVPHSWTKDQIEFHRNEGTWCGDNAIAELEALEGCLCSYAKFEYVGETSAAGIES